MATGAVVCRQARFSNNAAANGESKMELRLLTALTRVRRNDMQKATEFKWRQAAAAFESKWAASQPTANVRVALEPLTRRPLREAKGGKEAA